MSSVDVISTPKVYTIDWYSEERFGGVKGMDLLSKPIYWKFHKGTGCDVRHDSNYVYVKKTSVYLTFTEELWVNVKGFQQNQVGTRFLKFKSVLGNPSKYRFPFESLPKG